MNTMTLSVLTFLAGMVIANGSLPIWNRNGGGWPSRYGYGPWTLRYYDPDNFMFTEQHFFTKWHARAALAIHNKRHRNDTDGYRMRLERSKAEPQKPTYIIEAERQFARYKATMDLASVDGIRMWEAKEYTDTAIDQYDQRESDER